MQQALVKLTRPFGQAAERMCAGKFCRAGRDCVRALARNFADMKQRRAATERRGSKSEAKPTWYSLNMCSALQQPSQRIAG